jgi:hypothetical protein
MDADKAQSWANDEDPLWSEAREKYDTVQDRDGILAGIEPYLPQHQCTADHIYRRWLCTTEWAVEYQD